MLQVVEKNKYRIEINVREYFEVFLNFEMSCIQITYFCKTYNFSYLKTYMDGSEQFIPKNFMYIQNFMSSTLKEYLKNNIISNAVFKAFKKFEVDFCNQYLSLYQYQTYNN